MDARSSGQDATDGDRSSPHPGVLDPDVIDRFVRILGPLVRRMWPGTLHGLSHLPSGDRFVVVSNHSGMGTAELWSLMLAWHDGFGRTRKVAGMAHPGAFRVPWLRDILHGVGAVEATQQGAEKARKAGAALLVFPGGDHEASRPIWQAHRVDFAGRMGWIRLARKHRLAIVPMCITGSHVTLPILAHGKTLSWILGLRSIGVHRAPLPVLTAATMPAVLALARSAGVSWPASAALAWSSAWLTLMLPFVPAEIGFHILPPISVEDLEAQEDSRIYVRVVGSLQHQLDVFSRGRWWGRRG